MLNIFKKIGKPRGIAYATQTLALVEGRPTSANGRSGGPWLAPLPAVLGIRR
jgi:hypothetical protein